MDKFVKLYITFRTKGIIKLFLAIYNFFLICFYKIFFPKRFIKKNIFNYKMFLNPNDQGISRTLILFSHRELDHKKILELILKKNMKIFDIGANIGYYALMESKLIGDTGRIIAIEPVPENINLLKRNLKLNNDKITTTMQIGVSAHSGKKQFSLSNHSNLGYLITNKTNLLNSKNKKIITINTLTIEEIIKKTYCPDFLRMDVEGGETEILNNLSIMKLKKYPIVCFETHTSKYNGDKMAIVLKKMFQIGYKVILASSSSEKSSIKLRNLGYLPLISNIKTDDVVRGIYSNLKHEDAINLICYEGGLRTILMKCDKK